MRALKKIPFLRELAILLFLLFAYKNFLYKKDLKQHTPIICADGRGYYEYLPATFIYKDFHFSYLDTIQSEFYPNDLMKTFYENHIDGHRVDKYFIGTAVMQAPFFLVAHFLATTGISSSPPDGFSAIYQRSIFYAALFYLFLGLIFIRKLLQSYNIHWLAIFVIQGITLFGTPLMHYVLYDSAYSHVYSFFLISAFIWVIRSYFMNHGGKLIVMALILLGLIIIVRPVNVLVLCFLPVLTPSFRILIKEIKYLIQKQFSWFALGIFTLILILSIQCVNSYLQTENAFKYTYGEEGFNFLNPQFFKFLFSYHKGFFLWTPWWLLVFVCSSIVLIGIKKWYYLFGFLGAFIIIVYVFSSWHAWSYGASIGQRPMVDFYAVFILAFIPILKWGKKWISYLLLGLAFPVCLLMQVQIMQYEKAIIVWDGMNKEIYWKTFLILDDKYSWYFSKPTISLGEKQQELKLKHYSFSVTKPLSYTWIDSIPLGFINSETEYVECYMELNRTPESEAMNLIFYDDNNQEIANLKQGLFFNHFDNNKVSLRVILPKNKDDFVSVKVEISNIELPLKIKEAKIITYKKQN